MSNTMEGEYIDMFAKEQFQKFHVCVQLDGQPDPMAETFNICFESLNYSNSVEHRVQNSAKAEDRILICMRSHSELGKESERSTGGRKKSIA